MLYCMTLPWSNTCESRDLLALSSYIEEFIAAVHVSLTTAKEFAGAVICRLILFLVLQLKEFKHTQLDFCFVDLWHYREAEEWRIHWRLWLRTLSKSLFCSVLTSLWLALLQMNQFLILDVHSQSKSWEHVSADTCFVVNLAVYIKGLLEGWIDLLYGCVGYWCCWCSHLESAFWPPVQTRTCEYFCTLMSSQYSCFLHTILAVKVHIFTAPILDLTYYHDGIYR